MKTILCGLLAIATSVAGADDRVLSDAAWREDLRQLEVAIREDHFRPFHALDETGFAGSVESLFREVPTLSDHEIMVRMAALVAAIGDGHTRLTLPVVDPSRLARLSHAPPAEPAHPALRFRLLPLRLRIFADGVFVVAAVPRLQALVGAELIELEGVDIKTVLERVATTVPRDNQGTLDFLVPNHMIMPDLLRASGVPVGIDAVSLALRTPDGEVREIDVRTDGNVPDAPVAATYAARRVGETLLLDINEIGDDPASTTPSLANFIASAVARAEEEKLRVVLDLRHNTGGRNSLNQPILQSILRSRFVDRPGQLYVLIGDRTFSAAQSLVNDLERLTNAIFVGEPTGSSPSHYGDAKKVRLDNSGLVLRVSSIWWQSWLAGDFRDATPPHLPVAETSADHFADHDAALHAAMTHIFPGDPVQWFRELLEGGQVNAAAIDIAKRLNDPAADRLVLARRVCDLGESYLEAGEATRAYYVYAIADGILPTSASVKTGLGRARELREEPDQAIAAYRQALDIDSRATLARERLDALTGDDKR